LRQSIGKMGCAAAMAAVLEPLWYKFAASENPSATLSMHTITRRNPGCREAAAKTDRIVIQSS
jgi:hypothetical protein